MKHISTLIKGSIALTVSNLTLKAMNFFLLPLYTGYLTPEEMGVSDMITSAVSFIFTIMVLALDSAYSAFYFDEDSPTHRKKVFNTLFFVFAGSAAVVLCLCAFSKPLSSLIFDASGYGAALALGLLSTSAHLIYLPFSLELRMQKRMTLFSVITVVASFSAIMMNVFFVTVLHLSYYSLILSTLLTNCIYLVLYVCGTRSVPRVKNFDKPLLGKMLKYSLPLLPMSLAFALMGITDRYVINAFFQEAEVGIYGIANRMATVLSVFTGAFFTAYPAFAFENAKEEGAKEQFPSVLNTFFLLFAAMCFTISLFAKEIITLMTTEGYHAAYRMLPMLVFGQLAYGLSVVVGYGSAFVKKSTYNMIAVCCGAVVNLICNLIFVPRFGAFAAACTTLAGYVVIFLVNYLLAQRVYPCRYQIMKLCIFFVGLWAVSVTCETLSFGMKIVVWCAAAIITTVGYRKNVISILKFCLRRKDAP